MTRYLFLANSGKLDDGGLVLNRQLSEALARDNDVQLVTIGPCEQWREGVDVIELDETLLSREAAADIRRTRYFVDRFSKTIRAVLEEQGLERVGLPTDSGAFDVIVGYGDVTGPAALYLRDTYYSQAKVSTVITMDPKELFKALDLPELGEHRTESHREVLARSDLILAHGPKSAVDARQLATEWSRTESLPPTHEFVPGVETGQEAPAHWRPGERFNVLMLGRMHDLNKGAVDTALAVHALREDGYEDVHLTLRGVDQESSYALIELLDRRIGEGEWQSFVHFEAFTDDEEEKRQSIRDSHVQVVATESEAYGLASSEYAAYGKPLIVAEGYGNGFVTFLRDEERIPPDIADRFVLDDRGSRSAKGSFFGKPEGDLDAIDRYILIADRLEDVYNDYDSYVEVAGRLRGHLNEYTLDHTAAGIDRAVNENLAGNIRHTKQGPLGVIGVPSKEELLKGISEDKRSLVLDLHEASPRRRTRETTPQWREPEAGGSRTIHPTTGGRQEATESDVQPLSVGAHLASEDDSALVDRVILDELLSKPGAPVPSRFEMLMTGMSVEDVDTAIAEWEALGRPERSSGEAHSDERIGPETGGGLHDKPRRRDPIESPLWWSRALSRRRSSAEIWTPRSWTGPPVRSGRRRPLP
ncbi:glycosyltransferase [Nocardiopsis alba]|uniref:glycosyltransferase n=1 Tax=Nocardiopsis alba TaxID=53437 RepID=UPI003D706B30